LSSQAHEARKAFAIRLRDLRKDAGLTGRELAKSTGMHNTKISRIEHAQQNPSEDDIRAWAIACGAARQIQELIAIHREVEQMWVEYRQELRKGQKHIQARGLPEYERTKLLRAYEAIVIPGILQTRGYVRAVLSINAHVHGLPIDDVEEAVDARLQRQHLISRPTGANSYAFVIEASVLTFMFGGAEAMREQLDFLLAVTGLPHVSLGIIPPGIIRKIWGGECFYIFDEEMVRSEMWTGGFKTSRPEDIAFFSRVFAMLRDQAVHGHAARDLIESARRSLQTGENF
jgi:transcriptional regulator with XRE-family HTH domain